MERMVVRGAAADSGRTSAWGRARAGDAARRHADPERKRVGRVRFGLLSPDEVRAMSVVEVTHYESFEAGRPREHGPLDLRMGTLDKQVPCATCAGTVITCPGHFGHVELEAPVFHIGFMDHVLDVLRCVCMGCSRLLANRDDGALDAATRIARGDLRLRAVVRLCRRATRCTGRARPPDEGGCGAEHPRLRVVNGLQLLARYSTPPPGHDDHGRTDPDGGGGGAGTGGGGDEKGGGEVQLDAAAVRAVLAGITDADCRALGFDAPRQRPEWTVITALPVPPPCVRPSNLSAAGARGEDDLTRKLCDIVRNSLSLAKLAQQGVPPHVLVAHRQTLQYHVATYMDNEIKGQPQALQRSNRPLKSIRQRIRSKEGRVRGNLLGKRVDFSGRTVITPDPCIGLAEAGIPASMALTLTVPECVGPRNRTRLQRAVDLGPTHADGANFVEVDACGPAAPAGGSVGHPPNRIDLRYAGSQRVTLRDGMRVHRHLRDGDIVLLNRQPSLHKFSIMGHRARIFPTRTLRLNPTATTPYAAGTPLPLPHPHPRPPRTAPPRTAPHALHPHALHTIRLPTLPLLYTPHIPHGTVLTRDLHVTYVRRDVRRCGHVRGGGGGGVAATGCGVCAMMDVCGWVGGVCRL